MARRSDPNLHALWRERICRQEASGLTIEQFCVQEHIARSKFHAWKRRFRLMDSPDQCPALPAPSNFLPVTKRLDKPTPDPDATAPPIACCPGMLSGDTRCNAPANALVVLTFRLVTRDATVYKSMKRVAIRRRAGRCFHSKANLLSRGIPARRIAASTEMNYRQR
jgi:hypothetical protein